MNLIKGKRKWILAAVLCVLALVAAVCILAFQMVGVAGAIEEKARAGIGDAYDDPAWLSSSASSYQIKSTRSSVSMPGKNECKLSYGVFSGAQTLWTASGKEGEVQLEHEESYAQGRFKLVLVHPDGSIVDISEQPSPYVFRLMEGRTVLKAIGDAAQEVSVTLSINRNIGTWGND